MDTAAETESALVEAREEIRAVDEEMRALFLRRMDAVRKVAAYKRDRGLPIEDKTQEARVVSALSPGVPDPELRSYYVRFLHGVMDNSKAWQRHLVEGVRVAYSGVAGAFGHIAATQIFPEAQAVSYPSFEDAYRAVEEGSCDLAVLPFENSYAGEVGPVLDLMFSGQLYVNGVYGLSVTQNLLGVPGARLEDVRSVVSHPQALAQCETYIRAHGLQTRTADNTAVAARQVAAEGDPSVAAIASVLTARLHGLQVLDHDINESGSNTTRFAVFSRIESLPVDKREKAAFLLLFTVKDEAGGLAKAVNAISGFGFNMHVLRSRPMKDLPWHYFFYVEAEGDDISPDGKRMMDALRASCPQVKLVGRYVADLTLREPSEADAAGIDPVEAGLTGAVSAGAVQP